jgi:hypothetical protein
MKFNTMYVSKWADGDPGVTRVIETPTFTLHSMVVGNDRSRAEVIADYCRRHMIHSVVLCPGFSHSMVAEVVSALGKSVSGAVSRADGPGSEVTGPVKSEARKGIKQ